MSKRVRNHEAEQLLAGSTPEGRPELVALTDALVEFRAAAYETVPRPSDALAAFVSVPGSADVSAAAAHASAKSHDGALADEAVAGHPHGGKRMFEWITGLSVAAKVAAGTGVLALGATGVATAGATGVLPGPVQTAFDTAVTAVLTDDEVADDGLIGDEEPATGEAPIPGASTEFGKWVSENAQDPEKVGADFGERVSEQARQLGEQKRAERPERPGAPEVLPTPTPGAGDDEVEGDAPAVDLPDAPVTPELPEQKGGPSERGANR
ncbi:hypothetical protein EV140_2005 [Microcella alkaliphila]|uniref:Uncharacterized protein n=1 Tax=Microcella alkaliphila TaxID=279828 RepID=A0A4V2FMY5_9MICO|nr:hypothetical protein [Microcella alkaliphila]RZT59399.1 hypothetical protein EV140_2005 [Microcella alkaliphila]